MKKLLTKAFALCLFTQPLLGQVPGWKEDINFMPVPYGQQSHIYKGTIDNADHSYLLQYVSQGSSTNLVVNEFLPNGVNGFSKTIRYNPQIGSLSGHNDLGIAVDDNFVYAVNPVISNNIFGFSSVDISTIDKADPNAYIQNATYIYGRFFVTDLKVKNNFLYIYGHTSGGSNFIEFLNPNQSSEIFNTNRETAIVAKYNISNGVINAPLVWAKKVFQSGSSQSSTIEIDDLNRVYVSGSADSGSQLSSSLTINFPIANYAAIVTRLDINGDFDPTFAPIVIDNNNNPLNSTLYNDFIDDLELDPQTNNLYISSQDIIRNYETNSSTTPNLIWSTTIANSGSSRLAISACNEMYVTGTKSTGTSPIPQLTYFTQSLNKLNGSITNNLVSSSFNGINDMQGEVILIQSDGDKIIAGDYNTKGNIFPKIDYDHWYHNPTNTITYNNYSNKGSFLGIYYDGVLGDLTVDLVIENEQGIPTSEFNCGQDVLIDGTASNNETNHFVDVWKEEGAGTLNFQYLLGFDWLGNQADLKNLSQMVAAPPHNKPFTPGTYQVKLAIQNDCIGWIERTAIFTIAPTTISAQFSSLNTNTPTPNDPNIFQVKVTANETDPTLEHLWWVYDITAGKLISFSFPMWSPSTSMYTFTGLIKGQQYSIVHLVRDPSGCSSQANHSHFIGQSKNARPSTSSLFTSEMEEILTDIETGHYDHLISIQETNEVFSTGNFKLFPNPAQESVTIFNELEQVGQFNLLSIDGKILSQGTISPLVTENISLDHLAKGMYFIQVNYVNGNSETKRFIKK